MLFEVASFINRPGYFLRRDSDCRSSSLLQMYKYFTMLLCFLNCYKKCYCLIFLHTTKKHGANHCAMPQ